MMGQALNEVSTSTREKGGGGSADIAELISAFTDFYSELSVNKLQSLGTIYQRNVVFKDPILTLEGLPALSGYFEHTLKNCTQCSFQIVDVLQQANSASIQWKMRVVHPRLNANREILLDGISMIKIDQKIVFQQDFYDLGAMLYEHVPLLGAGVRTIKSRLRAAEKGSQKSSNSKMIE